MIRINLCPLDELESPYWYVPDVFVLILVALLSYGGVEYYLGTIHEQISLKTQMANGLKYSYDSLAPDLQRFTNLQKDIAELNSKLSALRAITVSKISKYKPVIVVEHLQNLRPDGLWYKSAKIFPDYRFELRGQAFDGILVSELMATMKATAAQEADEADLRTQVYFTDVNLEVTGRARDQSANAEFPELAGFPEFHLTGKIADRAAKSETQEGTPEKPKDGNVSQKTPAAKTSLKRF